MSAEAASGAELKVGTYRRQLARRLALALPQSQAAAAALDARLIIAEVLGLPAGELLRHDERRLQQAEKTAVAALSERRIAGEPIARIVGAKEFWGLELALARETLVPRPETETLVEAALCVLSGRRNEPVRILDLGTGSGAILLALLSELSNAFGLGTDIAPGALRTAAKNAAALNLSSRLSFLVSDWGAGIEGSFDLVLSNPPYIASATIETLDKEVRLHDPLLALDGGADGLNAYRSILPRLPAWLSEHGYAFLEIGADQALSVSEIAQSLGLATKLHVDLEGRHRAVELRRSREA